MRERAMRERATRERERETGTGTETETESERETERERESDKRESDKRESDKRARARARARASVGGVRCGGVGRGVLWRSSDISYIPCRLLSSEVGSRCSVLCGPKLTRFLLRLYVEALEGIILAVAAKFAKFRKCSTAHCSVLDM